MEKKMDIVTTGQQAVGIAGVVVNVGMLIHKVWKYVEDNPDVKQNIEKGWKTVEKCLEKIFE